LGNDRKRAFTSEPGRDVILRAVQGGTLHDKVRCCEICEVLNVKPLLRIERSPMRWSSTW